ncbi:MAG TPA: bifunctional 4-hydroxy-2-oxoglutarate aldolase/2-dehydro-3-deoxy-phosphogluconate aldolase [Acidobacteriaceae bacterium]|jgi:2-dehydro-3-deoxyphosphogluconate aldolase/(4S)-4-hydroxy-2-oxoglutarate aldolase|nr:bifunctional 4-hydroxy-2-oxoglutarate aldolase/2-dehydro-3-deoxy-phosphogluconate aldolase [Acidobacteriaceae bacterium]
MGKLKKTEVLARMHQIGIVPVLRATSANEALAIAQAIEAGGVPILEVTMTVPGAIRVIEHLVEHGGDRLLIGAGTVLDAETARACILAGAQFVVSPALDLRTIELCRRYSVPILPGALTPTEIVAAWQAGADAVKVFPCSAVGGAKYLKAVKAPLPQIDLIPTGGVSLATAAEFLEAGAFALGVGGDLVDNKAIANGHPEIITESARKYLAITQQARGH